ncbi:MAG: hypothetical protein U0736_09285 [Gemmataceae bacterium]
MSNDITVVALVALSSLVVVALLAGLVLVIRDTVRRRGVWGINLRPVRCPACGEPAPVVRRPQNRRQALWGGCTCEACGTEYDKWGVAIADANDPEAEPGASGDRGA